MYEYELIKKGLSDRGFDVASDKKVANIVGLSERRIREFRLAGKVDDYDADRILVGAGVMPHYVIPTWVADGMNAAEIAEGRLDPNAI